MKLKTNLFILLLVVVLAAMAAITCPNEEKMESATMQGIRQCAGEDSPLAGALLNLINDDWMEVLAALGGKHMATRNYIVLSATWMVDDGVESLPGVEDACAIGAFGHVWVYTDCGTKCY